MVEKTVDMRLIRRTYNLSMVRIKRLQSAINTEQAIIKMNQQHCYHPNMLDLTLDDDDCDGVGRIEKRCPDCGATK